MLGMGVGVWRVALKSRWVEVQMSASERNFCVTERIECDESVTFWRSPPRSVSMGDRLAVLTETS